MDDVVKSLPPLPTDENGQDSQKPSRAEAEAAVRTLLRWAGDDPRREGLRETPARVTKAFEEFFRGYTVSPEHVLDRVFAEVDGYEDLVLVRDIRFVSHCEHHVVPFFGRAHIGYYPSQGVVGLSKLARLVDAFAHRLQTQETMTVQIADAIDQHLSPRGVAVLVEAEHMCMSMRGVHKPGSATVTSQFLGVFHDNPIEQTRFYSLLRCTKD